MVTTSARRSTWWWIWGVLVTVLAVLAATVGGLAVRRLYATPVAAIPALPATSTSQVAAEPGSDLVQLSPGAAQHPDSGQVQWLLQVYFSAINNKRYDQWATTVVAKKLQELPEKQWLEAFSSTTDGSIRVADIETAPGNSLRVLLTFTSVQDIAHAPPQLRATCVQWRVVYPLVQDSGGLRLDATVLPGSVAVSSCS